MARVFEARYHGRCADCDDPIRPGDFVRFRDDDDLLIHDDCDDARPPEPTHPATCPTCHLAHAGECY
jgi:hypothetical protein